MADYELEFGNTSLPETPWKNFGEEINHLVIKDGVTYIGKYSLTAMLIEEINVPNSVTEIAEGGLMLNPYTKKIVVGDGVTSIGKWGFMMSPAREVTLGSGVRFIGEDAMVYEFLYDLTLKGEPFETWTGYEPGGEIKTHDLENEFKIFVSNSTYASWKAKYAETIGDHFFSPIEGGSTWVSGGCEVTIHDDRTMTVSVSLLGGGQMADYASVDDVPWKQYAKEIKQVTFGDGVAKIGANAFAGFTSTLNVYFEGSNALDWSGAATDFAPITTFHFLQDKPWLDRLPALKGRYCEMDCGDGLIWKYDKDQKVIDIVQSDAKGSGEMNDYDDTDNKAPWYSFLHEQDNGITINIGKGVTYLGKYAFYGSFIDNVNQPATLTSCGEGAFMNSTITRFEIPATMTVVPDYMFYNSRLKGEIVIPDGVETIGKRAFAMCSLLKRVYLPKTLKTIDEDAFNATDGHCKVYIYAAKPIDITWISSSTDFSTDTEFHVLAGHKQTWEKKFPNAQVQFVEDNYSEDQPFELSTANDWRTLCDYVSNGARGICVKMMNDIDLGEDCKYYVGTEANPYQGFFDGQGYTLTYNCKEFKSPRDFNIETGFRAPFHFIGGATIRNLRVDGLHADFYLEFEVWGLQGIVLDYIGLEGTKRSGGIVGQASGGVNRIENCRMSGKFRYGAAFCGGIVGQVNKGATLYLYNTVFDGESRLARNVNGTIFTYWQYPNECSPFVGRNQGTLNMENCYFSGTANTWGYSADLFVGRTDASTNATTNVVNCYYNGNLYGLLNNNGGIDASTMTTRELDNRLGSQWRISDDQTTVIPSLLLKPRGKGTTDDPYVIDNDLDWRCFIYYTTKMDGYDQKAWKQTSDISTTKWGAQLKGASASYDGQYSTLTLDVETDKQLAAPFTLAENADIRRLKVDGTLKGGIHSSGLVGECGQTVNITDCVVDADITFSGTDYNNARGGGFVGHARNAKVNMTECIFAGKLTADVNTCADGTWAGALVGWGETDSELTFTKCADLGTFDANVDHPDFIIRNITGQENSGGTLSHCYYVNGTKQDAQLTKVYPVNSSYITNLNVSDIKDYGNFHVMEYTYPTEEFTITYLRYNEKFYLPRGYLTDDDDNTALLAMNQTSGNETTDITILGRALYKDGSWNTLCLPFSVTDGNTDDDVTFSGTPLEGAQVKTLASSLFNEETGVLTLNFTEDLTTIEAGKPYLVRWDTGNTIFDPTFTNVSINNPSETTISADYMDFVGIFSPDSLKANDKTTLNLGADNKLYSPSADMTVGACRAVFRLKGLTADDLPHGARSIILNFGDEAPVEDGEIINVTVSEPNTLAQALDLEANVSWDADLGYNVLKGVRGDYSRIKKLKVTGPIGFVDMALLKCLAGYSEWTGSRNSSGHMEYLDLYDADIKEASVENELPKQAFQNAYNLKTLILPKTCRKVNECALQGCEALKTLVIGDDMEDFNWNALDPDTKFTRIYILAKKKVNISPDLAIWSRLCNDYNPTFDAFYVRPSLYQDYVADANYTGSSWQRTNNVKKGDFEDDASFCAFAAHAAATKDELAAITTVEGWFDRHPGVKDLTSLKYTAVELLSKATLAPLTQLEQVALPVTLTGMEDGLFENAKHLRYADFLLCNSTDMVASLRDGGFAKYGINTQQTLAYVPATYGETDETNVVVTVSGGSAAGTLRTKTYRLTDSLSYVVPYAFEAEQIENARIMQKDAVPYTICLPYKLEVPTGARAYGLSQRTGSKLVFEEVKGELEAMKPYLLKVVGNKRQRLNSANLNTKISQTIPANGGTTYGRQVDVPGYTLRGTFDALSNGEAAELGAYVLQADGNWHPVMTDTDAHQRAVIPPFRAYLLPNASNAGARIGMELIDDDATGIDTIETIDADGTHRYYDLQGREVDGSTKGIIISNGKKVIIK